jgi:hypothetical protein
MRIVRGGDGAFKDFWNITSFVSKIILISSFLQRMSKFVQCWLWALPTYLTQFFCALQHKMWCVQCKTGHWANWNKKLPIHFIRGIKTQWKQSKQFCGRGFDVVISGEENLEREMEVLSTLFNPVFPWILLKHVDLWLSKIFCLTPNRKYFYHLSSEKKNCSPTAESSRRDLIPTQPNRTG